ncbi:hypothetical protein [Thiorhodovibrio frisius]|uniref:Uncharacterized protein n=1 Tax=Thiorhodovibrio frisius TaxID=631362 RepID=H8Z7B6_9GAMM|nr:hypothetical protein [Thiorhodovibrio frisius]EIC19832.1 hypothetical protein Thi970DRAFT_03436 [Thiorhodovibrio frisius]WPL20560.1 hypothetical protein Thiofri_00659 [Thiorhodovibrio frisius]
MKKSLYIAFILITSFIFNNQTLADSKDQDCVRTIKKHGFLSRAQFQCGFNDYSNEMLQAAKACSHVLSDELLEQSLKSGMKIFDRNENERGHNELCEDILRDFPNMLRR